MFIGEPGVGKTAIAEGLAQRIANKDIPDILEDKRVVTWILVCWLLELNIVGRI